MNAYCQGPGDGAFCPEHPLNSCQVSSGKSNALEIDPVKPQTPRQVANLLTDWLSREDLSCQQAAGHMNIPNSILTTVLHGGQISIKTITKLSTFIPEIQA